VAGFVCLELPTCTGLSLYCPSAHITHHLDVQAGERGGGRDAEPGPLKHGLILGGRRGGCGRDLVHVQYLLRVPVSARSYL
jgi:hypothetical protein